MAVGSAEVSRGRNPSRRTVLVALGITAGVAGGFLLGRGRNQQEATFPPGDPGGRGGGAEVGKQDKTKIDVSFVVTNNLDIQKACSLALGGAPITIETAYEDKEGNGASWLSKGLEERLQIGFGKRIFEVGGKKVDALEDKINGQKHGFKPMAETNPDYERVGITGADAAYFMRSTGMLTVFGSASQDFQFQVGLHLRVPGAPAEEGAMLGPDPYAKSITTNIANLILQNHFLAQ